MRTIAAFLLLISPGLYSQELTGRQSTTGNVNFHPLVSQALPPVCTPTSGNVPVTVTCSNPNLGTTIVCYAVAPTLPASNLLGTACPSGAPFPSSLVINAAETVNWIAGVAGASDSPLVTHSYTTSQAESPIANPASGTVPLTVTITNPNTGTTVACCSASPQIPATNGLGTACTIGTKCAGANTISTAETLNTIAGVNGETDSAVNSYTYTAGASGTISQIFNGLDYNNTPLQGGNPQSVPTHGVGRIWDSGNAEWVWDESCNAVNNANTCFSWTSLDSFTSAAFNAGVPWINMALARTPQWAAQNNTGSTQCQEYNIPSGNTNECMPPTDLNNDGTGANLIWDNWVAGVAAHANAPGYQNAHAYIRSWEIWNEPEGSSNPFWLGSFNQLIRMEEDAYCIIKGSPTIPYPGTGVGSVSFTVTKASPALTCLQVRQGVDYGPSSTHVVNTSLFPNFPAQPLDPNAYIVAPSYHANTNSVTINYGQAFMYCTGPQANPTGTGFTACNPATGIGSTTTDIVNFHLKPGRNYSSGTPSGEMETVMNGWLSNIQGFLTTTDNEKPLFGTEGGYYGTPGWEAPYVTTDVSGLGGSCALQAGFVARYDIYGYALGLASEIWYNWKDSNYADACSDFNPNAVTAAQEANNWMVGSKNLSCGPIPPTSGALFTCSFTTPQGNAAVAAWYLCSSFSAGNPCTSYTSKSQTISSFFSACNSSVHQDDLAGNITTPASGCSTTVNIGNGQAAWGPLLFMNQAVEP